MIIEFFGVSGVGKTTLAREIHQLLVANGNEVYYFNRDLYENHSYFIRNLIRIFFSILWALNNINTALKIAKLLKYKNMHIEDYSVLVLKGLFLKYTLSLVKSDSAKYIIDEGIAQLVWSLFLRSNFSIGSQKKAEKLVSLYEKSHLLISVEAPADVIKDRLFKRGEFCRIMYSQNISKKINDMLKIQNYILKKYKFGFVRINNE